MATTGDGTLTAFVVHAASANRLGELLVVDTATGQRRWQVTLASDYSGVAHLDGTTVLADGEHTRGYGSDGTELWTVPSPQIARTDRLTSPGELVVEGDRLWTVGYDVHEIDPTDGRTSAVARLASTTTATSSGPTTRTRTSLPLRRHVEWPRPVEGATVCSLRRTCATASPATSCPAIADGRHSSGGGERT